MKKDPELRTCPFCGSSALLQKTESGNYTIKCSSRTCNVLAITLPGQKDEVIKYWNERRRSSGNKYIVAH